MFPETLHESKEVFSVFLTFFEAQYEPEYDLIFRTRATFGRFESDLDWAQIEISWFIGTPYFISSNGGVESGSSKRFNEFFSIQSKNRCVSAGSKTIKKSSLRLGIGAYELETHRFIIKQSKS